MKKIVSALIGIVLVALGLVFALNALEITNIDVFFDGWWTLFIIIPCGIGLFTEREKTGNIIGVLFGIILLLCSQGVLDSSVVWKLLVPAIIIVVGVKIVIRAFRGSKANAIIKDMKSDGKSLKCNCAVFSGSDVNFDGDVFEGAELTAVFGGIDYNLKSARIEKDCAIVVTAVFGGVDIIVPEGVNVKIESTCIFGGSSNKTPVYPDAPTLYVEGLCMFGGIEIK